MVEINEKITELLIPNSWISKFKGTIQYNDTKFALFMKNNPTTIRILTTNQSSATEFYLDLNNLEEDFLESLYSKLKSKKIDPLYSSGVCFVDDKCYYLFIMSGTPSEEETKEILDDINKIRGIKKIIIKNYNLE